MIQFVRRSIFRLWSWHQLFRRCRLHLRFRIQLWLEVRLRLQLRLQLQLGIRILLLQVHRFLAVKGNSARWGFVSVFDRIWPQIRFRVLSFRTVRAFRFLLQSFWFFHSFRSFQSFRSFRTSGCSWIFRPLNVFCWILDWHRTNREILRCWSVQFDLKEIIYCYDFTPKILICFFVMLHDEIFQAKTLFLNISDPHPLPLPVLNFNFFALNCQVN